MSAEFFVDTNVLIYAATGAGDEIAKRKRAFELLRRGGVGLSTQVLQEFYVNVTRKVQVKLTPAEATKWITQLEKAECFTVDRSEARQIYSRW